jgi:flagellar biosynthesis protein FlhG
MHDQLTRLRAMVGEDTAPPQRGYRVAVASGKGGVGKSTLSVNLAFALAETVPSLILVDADGNKANLDVMLGISPMARYSDLARGTQRAEDVLVTLQPGLRLLPGDSGDCTLPGRTWSPAQMFNVVDGITPAADMVLFDFPAGVSPETVAGLHEADEVVIVTTPEPTGIMDTYALIKLLTHGGYRGQMGVVVNAARSAADGHAAWQKLQTAVGHFLHRQVHNHGSIPWDQVVGQSVMDQEVLLLKHPGHPVASAFRSVAQTLESCAGRHSHLRRAVA